MTPKTETIKGIGLIAVILISVFGVAVYPHNANAEACFNRSLLGDQDIFWGDPPPLDEYQVSPRDYNDITANRGDVVRFSVEGELWTSGATDTCQGMPIEFQVYPQGSNTAIRRISGSLFHGGNVIGGNLGTQQWFVDWPNDLYDGTYVFKIVKLNGSNYNSIYSTNTLTIIGAGQPPCDTSFYNNQFYVCYFDGMSAPTDTSLTLSQFTQTLVPSPVGAWTGFFNDWGTGEVDSTGKNGGISGVWRGNINFQNGTYTFHTLSDDGVELKVGNNIVISNWTDHGTTQDNSAAVNLNGAQQVQLRWYNDALGAAIGLWWDFVPFALPPSCTASFSPSPIDFGQSSTLTWNSSNDADGTLQYSCTGNVGSGNTIASGTTAVNPTTSQTCTFTVVNSANTSATCSASVTVNPAPDYVSQGLGVSPGGLVAGQLVTFAATVKNIGVGSAKASSNTRLRLDINNDGSYDQTLTNQTTSALSAGATEVENWTNAWTAVAGTHKFEVCADNGNVIAESNEGNNCATQTFSVSNPLPTADIKCNNQDSCSVSYNTSANLTWTSTNTTNCSVAPGGGTGTSGGQSTGNLVSTVTYTLSCTGPGGSISDSVTVTVGAPPLPTADIKCNNQDSCSVSYNTSAGLTWTSTNATSCSVTPGGGTGTSGNQSTGNLTSTATYTLDCTGSGGSASDSVTVTVGAPPLPTASITCNGVDTTCSIPYDSTASLTWISTNSTSCSVTPGGGTGTSGSQQTENLQSDLTYTITCIGSGGSASDSVTVTVGPAPTPEPTPPPPAPESLFTGLNIPNPFSGSISTLNDLFNVIILFLYYIAGPIVVIMIILAGLFFLFGRGEASKVQTGKKILLYAVIGLAIILIGRGFIALINGIIDLGR